MKDKYLVSHWAMIRRNELVDIPQESLVIHPDFLQKLSKDEVECAFREIRDIFYQIYMDISNSPEHFGLPCYNLNEFD